MLQVETITSVEALATVEEAWRDLDEGLSPRNPFGSPLWCETWWRHHARRNLAVADHLRVFVLRRAGRVVAIAPMMLTLRPAIGPIRTRELQFLGADTNVTEIRGPICRAEDLPEVLSALDAHLRTSGRDWDWVQWRGLRICAERGGYVSGRLALENRSDLENHYLTMPASWKAFHASLPRNIKESLRKCYNSLARDGHSFEFRLVSDGEALEEVLQRFLALHSERAQATNTISHLDVFARPASRQFLFDYASRAAEAGNLRVFELLIGGEVVASRIGMVLGEDLYLYYTGYDQAWRRYSVMTTLLAEILKWAIANGFTRVNLSTGTDVSKMRWRPDTVRYVGGYQIARTLRAKAFFGAMNLARTMRTRGALPAAISFATAQIQLVATSFCEVGAFGV